jgi:hypothetical protein
VKEGAASGLGVVCTDYACQHSDELKVVEEGVASGWEGCAHSMLACVKSELGNQIHWPYFILRVMTTEGRALVNSNGCWMCQQKHICQV